MLKKLAFKKSLSVICAGICLFLVITIAYVYFNLNNIEKVPLPLTNEELGIHPWVSAKDDTSIRSIAIFGIDTGRNPNDPPHSDSIMIVTIDKMRNKLKVTSILRDTYVTIQGHEKSKINEAYAFGGPSLAVKTINENLDLDIRDYITVDFFGLSKIIDSVGGVNIDVEEKEVKEINKWTKELCQLQNKKPSYLNEGGMQKLNGTQAVAYARIRKFGAGDFDRSMRQRRVLSELFVKVKQGGIGGFNLLISSATPYLQSNIESTDMITTGSSIILSSINNIEMQRFPLDGYCKSLVKNGIWYLSPYPDIKTTARQLGDYIFNDKKPISKEPLF